MAVAYPAENCSGEHGATAVCLPTFPCMTLTYSRKTVFLATVEALAEQIRQADGGNRHAGINFSYRVG